LTTARFDYITASSLNRTTVRSGQESVRPCVLFFKVMTDDLDDGVRKGARTRARILDAATSVASVVGIQGLSIDVLAAHVGMSKSGLYAHFASKEALQLATIDRAAEVLDEEVVALGLRAAPGAPRVRAMADAFLSYIERRVFPGGCFFVNAAAELAAQPGPVRDRIAHAVGAWMSALAEAFLEADDLGALRPGITARQAAFEANAMLMAASVAFSLFEDPDFLERARVGIGDLLREDGAAAVE